MVSAELKTQMTSRFALLLGLGITIGVVILSIYTSSFGVVQNPDLNIVVALFVAVLGFIVTERVATLLSIDEGLRRATNEIRRPTDIIEFPDSSAAIEYFLSISEDIEAVRNTHLKTDVAENVPERFFSSGLAQRLHRKRRQLIDGGTQWTDIAAQISDGRFSEFVEWARKDARRRYFARKCVVVFPYCNFMIITFKSGGSEVLFGWPFSHSTPAEGRVFLSRNEALCAYFRNLFDRTYNDFSDEIE